MADHDTGNSNERSRRRRGLADRKPLLLVLGGLAAALLLAALIWRLGGEEETKKGRRLVDLDRIVIPSVPTREELIDPASDLDRDAMSSLRQGASVQVADESGRLAQEYGAARIDPLPDDWIEMAQPWARLHPEGGRVIEMQARDGTMRVPDQAIESGRLEGDVRIRLYEPGARSEGTESATPSVVIDAEVAEYDAGFGEIRSRKRVRVETRDAVFVGEDLRIVLGSDGTRIERLTVARPLEPIRIRRAALAARGLADGDAETVAPRLGARGSSASTPASGGVVARSDSAQAWQERGDVESAPVPAASRPSSSPAAPVDPDAVYRLVLQDDVIIERRSPGPDGGLQRSTVSGDRLVALFQLGETSSESVAGGSDSIRPPIDAAAAPSPRALVAASAFAATTTLVEDVVLVHYSGQLVMTPDPEAAADLRDAEDARLLVDGLDGRGIDIVDDANDAVGTAARLEYRMSSDRVALIGNDIHPFRIESPRFSLVGGRFWFEQETSTGGLIGPGRMEFLEELAGTVGAAVEWGGRGVELALHRMVADAGAGVATAQAVLAAVGSQEESDANEPPRLEIVWEGGVDLDFLKESEARLRQARFQGDVQVAGEAFQLGSQSLVVDFDPEGDADAIERILAEGDARVDRVGETGTLEAETIDLGLDRTADGRTIPRQMIAEGGVAASDPSQTLWTERLVVTFKEVDGDAAAPGRGLAGGLAGRASASDDEAAPGGELDEEFGQIEVHTVAATEAVQVRLDEGARVFADRLEGDAQAGVLELGGQDVMVLRGNVVADRMREVRLDDTQRTVRSNGPGRFRYYDEPVVEPSQTRIDRPEPRTRTSLAATWREAMAYRQSEDGARGRLDLEGDVRVRSTPDAKTSDRLDARTVGLDLKHGAGGVRERSERRDGDLLAREGDTTLERLVARGDAVLESRTWEDARKTGDPRLFRVTGDDVVYKVESGEAEVRGPGGLLVHDPRPDDDRPASAPVEAGFGVDGTTRFSWKRGMNMTREIDGRYLVIMDQDVEVLHAGLAAEDTMTLTGDRLEVTIDRPEEENAAVRPQDTSGIELGGPADLARVRGLGRVFVRTPEHDVECEEFDYNVDTGIAILRAAPGRVVTVQSKAARTPIRAERIQWDLRSGRLRILGGEGGIVR